VLSVGNAREVITGSGNIVDVSSGGTCIQTRLQALALGQIFFVLIIEEASR